MSELAFTVELSDGTVVASAADQAQAVNLAAAFALSNDVHVYDAERTVVAWAGISSTGPTPAVPLELSAEVDPEDSQHYTFVVNGASDGGTIDFGDGDQDEFDGAGGAVEHDYADAGNFHVVASAEGQSSAELYVDVSPAPEKPLRLNTLDPDTVEIGGNDIVLTCNGSGFEVGAVIVFAGHEERTDYLDETQVSTIVKPTLFLAADTVTVSVQNPDGAETGELTFTFTEPAPPPES